MGMGQYGYGESLAQVRERVAGLDQKVASSEVAYQREIAGLRSDFNDKFAQQKADREALKIELKSYIDQKFVEMGNTIRSNTAIATIPSRFYLSIVMTGIVSAVTFVAFVGWLMFMR